MFDIEDGGRRHASELTESMVVDELPVVVTDASKD